MAISSALLLGVTGPAHRLELIDLGAAFGLLRRGAYLALGAAVLGLTTLLGRAQEKKIGARVRKRGMVRHLSEGR